MRLPVAVVTVVALLAVLVGLLLPLLGSPVSFQPQEVMEVTGTFLGELVAVGLLAVAPGVAQAAAMAVVEEPMAVMGVALPGLPLRERLGRDQVAVEEQHR